MSNHSTDADAVIGVALASAPPTPLDDDKRYVAVVPEGHKAQVIDPLPESEQAAPSRKRGTVQVLDVASYAAQYSKHAVPAAETFADPQRFTVTALLNADDDEPGFRDHRLVLALRKTPQWLAWETLSGRGLIPQQEFAEFLEDRAVDVQVPTSAEVLELAQHFEATTNVDFQSADVVSSGERKLVYKETVAAKAGQNGDLSIPTILELALQPFEGGDAFKVNARFRYRIRNGSLLLGITLERPEDVLKLAFTETCEAVGQQTGAVVLLGTAPVPV